MAGAQQPKTPAFVAGIPHNGSTGYRHSTTGRNTKSDQHL